MTWLDLLNKVIRSALSCSEVAQRLWSSPWNKVCADCGSPNPEWASINLLMVTCETCAGEEVFVEVFICEAGSVRYFLFGSY